jgi:uncharacterized protein YlzI (FlbEa/FlbD family)
MFCIFKKYKKIITLIKYDKKMKLNGVKYIAKEDVKEVFS